MAARADKADDRWAQRLGFPAGDTPFGDTYDVIFRHCSSAPMIYLQGDRQLRDHPQVHWRPAPVIHATAGLESMP